jgi:hypothetical protein
MTSRLRIEKLRRDHAVEGFDCGKQALNRFLERHAPQSQQAGASTTYLALDGDKVVGFHSLAVGQVDYADAPERLTKGLARHPVPIMLLVRLAVSMSYQGKKLGAGLLKDAMSRTLRASEIAGGPPIIWPCCRRTREHFSGRRAARDRGLAEPPVFRFASSCTARPTWRRSQPPPRRHPSEEVGPSFRRLAA